MRIKARWCAVVVFVLTVLAVGTLPDAGAAEPTPEELGLSLLRVGEVKPGAAQLSVSTNTPAQGFYAPGDRVTIALEAPRELFVTILHVADTGDVTILYPDKDKTETAVPVGEKHVLFGAKSDSYLVAGKEMTQGGTVAYVSPRQFSVALMRFFQGKQWMEIAATATQDLNLLKEKLEIVSTDKGFNRIEIPVKGKSGNNCALKIGKQGRAITRTKGNQRSASRR